MLLLAPSIGANDGGTIVLNTTVESAFDHH